MKVDKKDLGKQIIELTVEVEVAELAPQLEKAAVRLASKIKIPGFRPGKAPYDIVKAQVGEAAIYQESLQDVLQETFWQALQNEKIVTIGQPEINITKIAPGNPLVYTAKVALMPEVTLGDWQSVKVEKAEFSVTDEDVEKVINDFAAMQAKETLVERAAKKGDKVEVDFEVYVDKVLLEGGSGKKYPIVLGSGAMIPGFEDNIEGLKNAEEKKFTLNFPKEYFQNHLSGKEAEFTVKLQAVFDRELPELNDDWAKKFGAKSLADFKAQIKENLLAEKSQKADEEWERRVIEAIVAKCQFSDFPEILVKGEIEKMKHEWRHSVEQKGMKWENYLNNLKKTEEQIDQDFKPQAEQRIQGAMVLRKLAADHQIKVDPEEVDHEIKHQEELYGSNQQALQNIQSPGYRQYVENILINRKVIALIKEKTSK